MFRFYHPVCGHDAKTYTNSCKAKWAGTEVKCHGICPCSSASAGSSAGRQVIGVATGGAGAGDIGYFRAKNNLALNIAATGRCQDPKGAEGSVIVEGCIKSTCTDGRWEKKPTM